MKVWSYRRGHIYARMFVEVIRSKVEGFIEYACVVRGKRNLPPFRPLSALSNLHMPMPIVTVVVSVGKQGWTVICT